MDRDLEAAGRELDAIAPPGHAGLASVHAELEYSRGHWGADWIRLVGQAVERDPQNNRHHTPRANARSVAGWFSGAARLLARVRIAEPTADAPRRNLTPNLCRWTGDPKPITPLLDEIPRNNLRNGAFSVARAERRAWQGNLAAALADLESAGKAGRTSMEEGNNRHTLTYQRAWFESLQANAARPAKLSAQTPAEEKALAWDATTARVALPALVTARLGRREEAGALLAQVMAHGDRTLFASNRADLRMSKAAVHAALGHIDEAVATLRTEHEMSYGFGHSLRLDRPWGHGAAQQTLPNGCRKLRPAPRRSPGRTRRARSLTRFFSRGVFVPRAGH